MNQTPLHGRSKTPQVKNSVVAAGLTAILSLCGIGLYGLCLDRQQNFEDKLVELETLKSDRRVLLSQNKTMRDRVAYLETDDGIEEIAREKLGLVRPGELAYAVVPPPPDSFTAADEEESPHLDSAAHQAEHEEDFGVVVQVLRHLFGTGKDEPITADGQRPEAGETPKA